MIINQRPCKRFNTATTRIGSATPRSALKAERSTAGSESSWDLNRARKEFKLVQSIKDCGTDIDQALAILSTFRSSPERAAEVTATESNNGKGTTQQRQKNGNIRQQQQQQQQHASPMNNARKNPASNYGKGFNNYHVPTPTTARAASITAAESKSKDNSAVLLRAYNAILHACSEKREVEKVLDLFKQMREVDQVTPDVISYRRTIFTCAKAELWKPALAFLQEMEANVIIPDVKCYCAVITACGRGI
jgi:pentatricopeptide repeat protein